MRRVTRTAAARTISDCKSLGGRPRLAVVIVGEATAQLRCRLQTQSRTWLVWGLRRVPAPLQVQRRLGRSISKADVVAAIEPVEPDFRFALPSSRRWPHSWLGITRPRGGHRVPARVHRDRRRRGLRRLAPRRRRESRRALHGVKACALDPGAADHLWCRSPGMTTRNPGPRHPAAVRPGPPSGELCAVDAAIPAAPRAAPADVPPRRGCTPSCRLL